MASDKPPKYHKPEAVAIREAMKKENAGSKKFQELEAQLRQVYGAPAETDLSPLTLRS